MQEYPQKYQRARLPKLPIYARWPWGLDEDDLRRLRWRKHKILIDSHPILCMTFDELYQELKQNFDLYAAAFKAEAGADANE